MERNSEQETRERANDRSNSFAVNLGLVSNIVLAFLKVFFGMLGHSPALLADGINSTSDVAYYIATKIFLRLSVEPADHEHPYGHRQMESIASVVVGAFILSTAVAIFWNALDGVYDALVRHTPAPETPLITLGIALFTICLKIALTLVTKRIGAKTNNSAIRALAFDHINDIFASLAAAVGIYFGREGFPWVDPLAGGVVALFILRTGINIIRESALALMSTAPATELTQRITGVAKGIPEISGIERIRVHTFGQYLVVNIDICIDGSRTIRRGDEISTMLESRLVAEIDEIVDVHVHYHPGDGACEEGYGTR
ncbi:MAG: cation transporter [Spirochaetes bacterium]|nr:MAG: cation transporter [Spirochaetota bacterium]